MTDGILIIDKPVDWTSHDVVGKLRRILKTKRIGHTGTLDPFATGVLVMLVGQATRLAQFLDKDVKEYEATVRLGFETDTGDLTGEKRETVSERHGDTVSEDDIQKVLPDFRGEIEQIPPMYSAKKVEGKKLYELARKGIEIERKPIKATIYELESVDSGQWIVDSQEQNLDTDHQPPTTDHYFRVLCTAGTYIRTLAEDIGRKLGTGAHLAALRRTRAGKFDLAKVVTIEQLEEIVSSGKLNDYLISMNEAVSHLAERKLNDEEINHIKNGRKIPAKFETENVQIVRITDSAENLLAIGNYNENEETIQPRIVFAN